MYFLSNYIFSFIEIITDRMCGRNENDGVFFLYNIYVIHIIIVSLLFFCYTHFNYKKTFCNII